MTQIVINILYVFLPLIFTKISRLRLEIGSGSCDHMANWQPFVWVTRWNRKCVVVLRNLASPEAAASVHRQEKCVYIFRHIHRFTSFSSDCILGRNVGDGVAHPVHFHTLIESHVPLWHKYNARFCDKYLLIPLKMYTFVRPFGVCACGVCFLPFRLSFVRSFCINTFYYGVCKRLYMFAHTVDLDRTSEWYSILSRVHQFQLNTLVERILEPYERPNTAPTSYSCCSPLTLTESSSSTRIVYRARINLIIIIGDFRFLLMASATTSQ